MPTFRLFAALGALVMLVACGGGLVTGPPPPPPPPPGMPDLLESGVARVSALTGVILQLDGAGDYTSGSVGGTIDHRDEGVTLTVNGVTTLVDPDGRDSRGTWLDPGRETRMRVNIANPAGVEHVAIFNLGGQGATALPLVLGQRPADTAAATGRVTYTGGAIVNYATTAGQGNNAIGSAQVVVDFGTDRADLRLWDFAGDHPFDTIRVTGMRVAAGQGSYGGGALRLNAGGRDVTGTVIGVTRSQDARGAFFGPATAGGRPDETGGLVSAQGSQGEFIAGYTAD